MPHAVIFHSAKRTWMGLTFRYGLCLCINLGLGGLPCLNLVLTIWISLKVCIHEAQILCHETQNSVGQHKIWSFSTHWKASITYTTLYDTNLIARHKNVLVVRREICVSYKQTCVKKNKHSPHCRPSPKSRPIWVRARSSPITCLD
jgi:hypothetical protein